MAEKNGLMLDIPGHKPLKIHHLVLDYNGTIACDGQLLAELVPQLNTLARELTIHVLTADTHGSVAGQVTQFPCTVSIIAPENQIAAKQEYLMQLGSEHCIAIGNGRNDEYLLRDAAIGIAIMHHEGVASATIMAADVVCPSCAAALQLLIRPKRLIATLRC